MAKYEVTHSCGHTATTQLVGPGKDRERKLAWLETILCENCAQVERVKAAAGMVALDEAKGFPKLHGSEKQITWASSIRHEAVLAFEKIERRLKETALSQGSEAPLAEQLLFELDNYCATWKSEDQAQWWIDRREKVSESAMTSHLYAIRHSVADQYGVLVAGKMGISADESREIMRLAIKTREAALDARRIAEVEREQLEREEQRKRQSAEQEARWKRKDDVAAVIFMVTKEPCQLTVWMPGTEKRVYVDCGKRKACLYVTGSKYNRPGKFEIGKWEIDHAALKAGMELAATRYDRLRMSISAEGKAE